ncbi:MAG: nucleotide pyrophosphohydrolase [Candidatus Parcubacteria bacterium]|nr:nucleotide pyrophosphohydrolase [Candidatus Parcubacteria bacterium]
MDLKDIIEKQKDFDKMHFGEIKLTPDRLLYLMTCLAGETGELANLVKKYYREKVRNYRLSTDGQKDFVSLIKEELTDVFIYTMILSYLLDVDLEKEFFNKLKKNEERFKDVNLNTNL